MKAWQLGHSTSDQMCVPAGKTCQITDASKSFAALVAEQVQAAVHVTAWSATGMTNAHFGAVSILLTAPAPACSAPFYESTFL